MKIITIRFLLIIGPCLLFANCKSLIESKYKMNKSFHFSSRNDYKDFLLNKYAFPAENIYSLDSSSYSTFLKTFDGTIFLGSFLDDSTQVAKSEHLKNNQSCIGRIGNEIEKSINVPESELKLDTSFNLNSLSIFHIQDRHRKLSIDSSKKFTIIIVYTFSSGTYYDPLYKEIIDTYIKSREKCDLKVISIDPIYKLF